MRIGLRDFADKIRTTSGRRQSNLLFQVWRARLDGVTKQANQSSDEDGKYKIGSQDVPAEILTAIDPSPLEHHKWKTDLHNPVADFDRTESRRT